MRRGTVHRDVALLQQLHQVLGGLVRDGEALNLLLVHARRAVDSEAHELRLVALDDVDAERGLGVLGRQLVLELFRALVLRPVDWQFPKD